MASASELYKLLNMEEILFELTSVVKGVDCCKSINNLLCLNKGGELFVGDTRVLTDVEGMSFWEMGDSIYCHTNASETVVVKDGIARVLPFKLMIASYSNSKAFCQLNFRRESRKWRWSLGMFDFERMELSHQFALEDVTVELVKGDKALCIAPDGRIFLFDWVEEKVDWEVLPQDQNYSKVIMVVGEHAGTIIVACDNNCLIGINIASGSVTNLSQLAVAAGMKFENIRALGYHIDVDVDVDVGICFGISSDSCVEIDLKNLTVLHTSLTNSFKNAGIRFLIHRDDYRCATSENIFCTGYTVENRNGEKGLLCCVLALNKKSKLVDWYYSFPDENLGTRSPVLAGDQLCISGETRQAYLFQAT